LVVALLVVAAYAEAIEHVQATVERLALAQIAVLVRRADAAGAAASVGSALLAGAVRNAERLAHALHVAEEAIDASAAITAATVRPAVLAKAVGEADLDTHIVFALSAIGADPAESAASIVPALLPVAVRAAHVHARPTHAQGGVVRVAGAWICARSARPSAPVGSALLADAVGDAFAHTVRTRVAVRAYAADTAAPVRPTFLAQALRNAHGDALEVLAERVVRACTARPATPVWAALFIFAVGLALDTLVVYLHAGTLGRLPEALHVESGIRGGHAHIHHAVEQFHELVLLYRSGHFHTGIEAFVERHAAREHAVDGLGAGDKRHAPAFHTCHVVVAFPAYTAAAVLSAFLAFAIGDALVHALVVLAEGPLRACAAVAAAPVRPTLFSFAVRGAVLHALAVHTGPAGGTGLKQVPTAAVVATDHDRVAYAVGHAGFAQHLFARVRGRVAIGVVGAVAVIETLHARVGLFVAYGPGRTFAAFAARHDLLDARLVLALEAFRTVLVGKALHADPGVRVAHERRRALRPITGNHFLAHIILALEAFRAVLVGHALHASVGVRVADHALGAVRIVHAWSRARRIFGSVARRIGHGVLTVRERYVPPGIEQIRGR